VGSFGWEGAISRCFNSGYHDPELLELGVMVPTIEKTRSRPPPPPQMPHPLFKLNAKLKTQPEKGPQKGPKNVVLI
jgi:hypothetical protein